MSDFELGKFEDCEVVETDSDILQLLGVLTQTPDTEQAKNARHRLIISLSPTLLHHLILFLMNPDISVDTKRTISQFLEQSADEMMELGCDKRQNVEMLMDCLLGNLPDLVKEPIQDLLRYWIENDFGFYGYLNSSFEVRVRKLAPQSGDFQGLDYLFFLYRQLKDRGWGEEMGKIIKTLIEVLPALITRIVENTPPVPPEMEGKDKNSLSYKVKTLLRFFEDQMEFMLNKEYFEEDSFKGLLFLYRQNESLFSHISPCILSSDSPSEGKERRCTTLKTCSIIFEIKHIFLEALSNRYEGSYLPKEVTMTVFQSVIQCNQVYDTDGFSSLMISCLKVFEQALDQMEKYVSKKIKKTQLFSSLFLLFTSGDRQLEMFDKDPEGFVKQIEACFSPKDPQLRQTLKSSVLEFLKRYIQLYGLKNLLLSDMLLLLRDALTPNYSTLIKEDEAKRLTEYAQYPFYHLTPEKKLDCLLLLLPALYSIDEINDEDMIGEINDFIDGYTDRIANFNSPLPTLRFFRLLYFFYSPGRFQFAKAHVNRGRVFVLEGIQLLFRYMRINQKELGLMDFLHEHLDDIINFFSIRHSWYPLLVTHLHGEVLMGNVEANQKLVDKIRKEFKVWPYWHNEKHCENCIAFLNTLIVKETDPSILNILTQALYELCLIIFADSGSYIKFEEKLIEACLSSMEKCPTIEQAQRQMTAKSLANLKNKAINSNKIFRYYNIYFARLAYPADELAVFYSTFLQEISTILPSNKPQRTSIFDLVFYYAFLMSQIIFIRPDVCLREHGLLRLFYIMKFTLQNKKQWILGVILSYAYMQPEQFADFLKRNGICRAFLKSVLRLDITERLFWKIFNLAYLKLLEINEHGLLEEKVWAKFIENMKILALKAEETRKMNKIKNKKLPYLRSHGALQKKELNLSEHCAKLQHPIQPVCELEQLRHVYSIKKEEIENRLAARETVELRSIIKGEGLILTRDINEIYEEDDECDEE